MLKFASLTAWFFSSNGFLKIDYYDFIAASFLGLFVSSSE
jgi:hypothetical protein